VSLQRGMMGAVAASDAWAELSAAGFSPFKVVCSAHRGSQLVRRGGARACGDGFVDVVWLPRGDSRVPQGGDGVVHADGSRTFELACPLCGQPKQVRQDSLVGLLQERAAAGKTDAKGRVVLDLAELEF
jgi:hypothetical protein